MGQVTKETIKMIRSSLAYGAAPPLTLWEYEQLCCAWERQSELKSRELDKENKCVVGFCESDLDQALRERDDYHDWADKLATAISSILDVEIGEHTSSNNPWRRALEAAEEKP